MCSFTPPALLLPASVRNHANEGNEEKRGYKRDIDSQEKHFFQVHSFDRCADRQYNTLSIGI